MTIRRTIASLALATAALGMTACGSAPSEASCKAAAAQMLVEVFAEGVDHSDSPAPRECDGFTDAEIQTFVFGAPLVTEAIDEGLAEIEEAVDGLAELSAELDEMVAEFDADPNYR